VSSSKEEEEENQRGRNVIYFSRAWEQRAQRSGSHDLIAVRLILPS
jgi:hypothetical protein